MKVISSRQNPIVRAYRELAQEPDSAGVRLLLDGAHLVREARDAALRFESVVVAASRLDQETEEGIIAESLEHAGVDVVAASDRVFEAISPVRTPSGIVAIAHHHSTTADAILEQARLFALVVVDVQDPGNLGSLMRVAEAGGVTGVIVAGESANPFSWKAIRGSMGSVLRVPVARSVSIDTVMQRHPQDKHESHRGCSTRRLGSGCRRLVRANRAAAGRRRTRPERACRRRIGRTREHSDGRAGRIAQRGDIRRHHHLRRAPARR